MNVKGKNIIITGGSLVELERETARDLIINGANVLITGRSEEQIN